tara:strand:+ start:200 stop:352 length:153 start_codon:yes stop_codon:yes gene_type:complete
MKKLLRYVKLLRSNDIKKRWLLILISVHVFIRLKNKNSKTPLDRFLGVLG